MAVTAWSYDGDGRRPAETDWALHREVVDKLPVGVAILKLEAAQQPDSLRIAHVNPAAQQIFGQPASHLVGRRLTEVYPNLSGDEVLQRLHDVVITQQPTELRALSLADAQGGRGSLRARCFPLPDACLGVAFEDDTPHSMAEEAQRASEERFRLVAETAVEAIISADETGNIIYWNKAAETIFGYTAAEVLGRPITPLMPDRFRAGHHRGIARLDRASTGRLMGHTVEMRGLHKDGREFPMELSLAPWTAGRHPFCTAIIRDISLRKQASRDLIEAHRLLANSNEEARNHLARELHDGPLQDLYGVRLSLGTLTEKLQDPLLGPALAAAQADLQAVSDRLRAICQELRPPTLAPFGLEAAIRSHAQQFQAEHPELELSLALDRDAQRLSDRTRHALYRIYRQALDNVTNHARARHVLVRLELEDEFANLSVQDDGVGFELPENWLAFARRGHLGLLGSAERAQSVGGRFRVMTAPGQGTEVKASAPFEALPDSATDNGETLVGGAEGGPA